MSYSNYSNENSNRKDGITSMIPKPIKWGIIAVVALILFLILKPFTIVGAGHTGVRVTMGSVSDEVLTEGFHGKIPLFQSIKEIDNRIQKLEVECASASKDLQVIHAKIAVNYKVINTSSASLYKNIGMDYANIVITPSTNETVKAITAKHTAEELITDRQTASADMKDLLNAKVQSHGIVITDFNIVNFDFSEEFNKAIEQKQTAQQMALKAEQDLARIKIEAEQQVAQAQAEADSLKLQKSEITPDLLELRRIEVLQDKWNGQLPQNVYIGGNSTGETTIFGIPLK